MSGSINHPWAKVLGLKDPDFNVEPYDEKVERLIEEIKKRQNKTPSPPQIPPQVDPFVYASQVATMQPKDRAWRLFQGVLFRIADVRGIVRKATFPNENTVIVVRFTDNIVHEFELPGFTKDDPTMWFSQHVLGMEFEFTPKP